jgi:anaerobic magnesium-protoporphyrin IX monomethyl ester cyclase
MKNLGSLGINNLEIGKMEVANITTMKTPEIMLIRAATVVSPGRIATGSTGQPLGIAYLASYLRKHNYPHVGIIDSFGESPFQKMVHKEYDTYGILNEEVVEKIPQDVRIIGFTCMFSNEWIYLKKLISLVKQRFPDALTIMGGEHASACTEYVLDSCPSLDYIIRGEGEDPFLRLVELEFKGIGEKSEISGLSYRTDEGVTVNPSHRVLDLAEIPNPAWDLVPSKNYLDNGLAAIVEAEARIMPILATRGCPYTCNFCSNEQMWGTLYRMREPEDVVAEIKLYKQQYDITGFELNDLTFIVNRKWLLSFAQKLADENLNLCWTISNTRSEAIDEEVVKLLIKAGCVRLMVAPESGSENQQLDMNKKVNLEDMAECVKTIGKTKLALKANFIVGLPNEGHIDILKSIYYGLKLAYKGVDSVLFYRFVPYPGTNYFNLLQEREVIPPFGDDFDLFLVSNVYNDLVKLKSYNDNVSKFALQCYIGAGFGLSFLMYMTTHPSEFIPTIKRIAAKKPKSVMEALILNLMEKKIF